ncbi:hypothetical protein Tco_1427006, partial [Tanacetum coccineum]
VIFDEKKLRSS